jgi:hypothetical protein
MKSYLSKIKNSVEILCNRLNHVEERISGLEEKVNIKMK